MQIAETVPGIIRGGPTSLNGTDHWRAGCGESSPVRFGKGPTEKDPHHGHLVGVRLHSEGARAQQWARATRPSVPRLDGQLR